MRWLNISPLILLAAATVCLANGSAQVTGLQCEYLRNPLGIDEPSPRLSWQIQSPVRGQMQTAYRILVSSSDTGLAQNQGDLWDTGKILSDQSIQVAYTGKPLLSFLRCHWKVQIWDKDGTPTEWSAPAMWSMGILNRAEWGGEWLSFAEPVDLQLALDVPVKNLSWQDTEWIWQEPADAGPSNNDSYFRKHFDLPENDPVIRAYILSAANELFEVFINGNKVLKSSRDSNAWNKGYTVELADLLTPGLNLIAADLKTANGIAGGIAIKLVVQFQSGKLFTLHTDGTWKARNKEKREPNWWNPELDDLTWPPATPIGKVGSEPWGNPELGLVPGRSQRISSPLFRKEFVIGKPVRHAMAYICGLGYNELQLNGKKVGDHVLDPALTRYDRRALYVTYDVTDQLLKGSNAIGVMLGNGWYNMPTLASWSFNKAPWRNAPVMKLHLRIEYDDGSIQTVVGDESWRASTGPVVLDSVRTGEYYDARREMPGWDTAGFDDSRWENPRIVDDPAGVLSAQMMPPIRVTQTIRPIQMNEPRKGVYVFDMGQNIAGWARLHVSGPTGTKISLRYGERLNKEGRIDFLDLRRCIFDASAQTDTYILKGGQTESWEPRFTYHGFRYVEVSGYPGTPTLDALDGRVVHTDFKSAGTFECSNELINAIQQLVLWSYRGNYHGYPTDCPQREKNGWTADAHLATEQAMYNFQNAAAYKKWIKDFSDEQRDDGVIPGIIPTSGFGYEWGNGPSWDSAYFLIPWYQYLYNGDTLILTENLDGFQRYVDYLTSISSDHIVSIGLPDWHPATTKTPTDITSTAYYYLDTKILAKSAALSGRKKMAETYSKQAEEIRTAFNNTFYDGNGSYANGSQTALSCALYQGLVEASEKEKVLSQLALNVIKMNDHLDVGNLGAKYLFHALSENDRHDLAWKVATQTTEPSYGNWVKRGATTLWERWTGLASLNHVFYGDISTWFYQKLAGIRPDPQHPGFKHVILHPQPVGDLKWVKAKHESMFGTISSSWTREGQMFLWDISIPPNTTATIYIPGGQASEITESGNLLDQIPELNLIHSNNETTVLKAGSGNYTFRSTRKEK